MISRLITIILVFLLLCSTASSKVTGSLGALMERDSRSKGLAGIFVEVNSQKYGGYISFTGMSEGEFSNRIHSFTHINLGVTYFIKKRLGFVIHSGVFTNTYQKYDAPLLRLYKNKPGDNNDDNYPDIVDWSVRTHFTYGGGFLLYTLDKNVVLHLKVSFVPERRNTFIGLGIGVHLGGK